jgi:hypothetical protein
VASKNIKKVRQKPLINTVKNRLNVFGTAFSKKSIGNSYKCFWCRFSKKAVVKIMKKK